ncbi:hypothetical protein AVEN_139150-1 [Araneus ventricosus]|uniref:Uncharacterized protein n=1 Tax=Araneus ventricosus TaxID=182803 RepID=A0A4Y2JLP5_ARAVE|nr:hypothetical protein AVEN_139150-1 [Araneus ventricosus]
MLKNLVETKPASLDELEISTNNKGEEDVTKNVDTTGESSVCILVHRDKARYPSAILVSETNGPQEET